MPDTSAAAAAPQPENSMQPASFEEGLASLAELVARLESGSLGLSESIVAYERGVGLLRVLHDQLASAEERVRLLVRIDEQGRPVLAAPDEQPQTTAPEAAAGRSAGRAGRGKPPRSKPLPGMDDTADGV
jgi:exodeoxyribonuclease VII small subunit